MVALRALIFQLLVKGNKDSGNKIVDAKETGINSGLMGHLALPCRHAEHVKSYVTLAFCMHCRPAV